jgi:pullulanase
VRKHLEFLEAPKGVVAFRLKNYAGRDDWRDIIVILNANKTSVEVSIPEGNYTVVCCDGQINEQGLGTLKGNKAIADPQSAIIIHNYYEKTFFILLTRKHNTHIDGSQKDSD